MGFWAVADPEKKKIPAVATSANHTCNLKRFIPFLLMLKTSPLLAMFYLHFSISSREDQQQATYRLGTEGAGSLWYLALKYSKQTIYHNCMNKQKQMNSLQMQRTHHFFGMFTRWNAAEIRMHMEKILPPAWKKIFHAASVRMDTIFFNFTAQGGQGDPQQPGGPGFIPSQLGKGPGNMIFFHMGQGERFQALDRFRPVLI